MRGQPSITALEKRGQASRLSALSEERCLILEGNVVFKKSFFKQKTFLQANLIQRPIGRAIDAELKQGTEGSVKALVARAVGPKHNRKGSGHL